MPGWTTHRLLVEGEFIQSKEEGRDPTAVEAIRPDFERAGDDPSRLAEVTRRLHALPIRPDFPFDEPSDLAAIRAARPSGPRALGVSYDDATLFERMHGAWLGRCVGCALGKPVEP